MFFSSGVACILTKYKRHLSHAYSAARSPHTLPHPPDMGTVVPRLGNSAAYSRRFSCQGNRRTHTTRL